MKDLTGSVNRTKPVLNQKNPVLAKNVIFFKIEIRFASFVNAKLKSQLKWQILQGPNFNYFHNHSNVCVFIFRTII